MEVEAPVEAPVMEEIPDMSAAGEAPAEGTAIDGATAAEPVAGVEDASSELGKRKDRWSGSDTELANGAAEAAATVNGDAKRSKITVPETFAQGVGELSTSLEALQARTGARITVGGKGSGSEGAEDGAEPLHVVVEGSDIEIATATAEIEGLLSGAAAAAAAAPAADGAADGVAAAAEAAPIDAAAAAPAAVAPAAGDVSFRAFACRTGMSV